MKDWFIGEPKTEVGEFAKHNGRYTATVIPGDGIGPEMINHIKDIFSVAKVPVDFEEVPLSSDLSNEEEEMNNVIKAIKKNGIALKGNIETKFDIPEFKSRNVELRRRLKLYANVLHCQNIPTVPSRHKDINMVLIRENMEGEYSGLEHETIPGIVESLKIVSTKNIQRIARYAFEYARLYRRNRITIIHKANIQKLADGLFLKTCFDMAKNEFPEIECNSLIVDNACMQLVSRPQQFDVVLMPNLYGNIISNVVCGLVGGPGLVSGINVGEKYAVFETGTRNTGTLLAGKDCANPTSFIRAGIDMLRYLALAHYSNLISDSLFEALTERCVHTKDIGGTAKTSDLVEAVKEIIEAKLDARRR
uniref:Iso_dh domain-containing protein n=1 Tax=Syphacia muris TaxID=451379 RepID=A0A0N5AR68_9BILA